MRLRTFVNLCNEVLASPVNCHCNGQHTTRDKPKMSSAWSPDVHAPATRQRHADRRGWLPRLGSSPRRHVARRSGIDRNELQQQLDRLSVRAAADRREGLRLSECRLCDRPAASRPLVSRIAASRRLLNLARPRGGADVGLVEILALEQQRRRAFFAIAYAKQSPRLSCAGCPRPLP